MPYTVTSGPSTEPITLAEVRLQLRLESDYTTDDDLLDIQIEAARNFAEEYTGRKLITQTIQEVFDSFPTEVVSNYAGRLHLSANPVQSVTSVTYLSSGSATTWDASKYRLSTINEPAIIVPEYGETWPTPDETGGAVTVTYVAGYSSASDVPAQIKQAMLLIVADMYENRESRVKRLPTSAEYLLDMWRIKVF